MLIAAASGLQQPKVSWAADVTAAEGPSQPTACFVPGTPRCSMSAFRRNRSESPMERTKSQSAAAPASARTAGGVDGKDAAATPRRRDRSPRFRDHHTDHSRRRSRSPRERRSSDRRGVDRRSRVEQGPRGLQPDDRDSRRHGDVDRSYRNERRHGGQASERGMHGREGLESSRPSSSRQGGERPQPEPQNPQEVVRRGLRKVGSPRTLAESPCHGRNLRS